MAGQKAKVKKLRSEMVSGPLGISFITIFSRDNYLQTTLLYLSAIT